MLLLATTCARDRLRADGPGAEQPARRRSSRRRRTGRSCTSTRCSAWARRWRRCWSRCSSGSALWWGLPLVGGAPDRGAARREPRACRSRIDAAPAATGPATQRPACRRRSGCSRAFALLYGIVETTSGNWATLYMTGSDRGVDGARVPRADGVLGDGHGRPGRCSRRSSARFPETHDLPAAAVRGGRGAGAGGAAPERRRRGSGVLVFGLAGLGCSALLPLTISFGQRDLAAVGAALSGLLIASYQVGYGIAAFGFGPLQDRLGVGLSADLRARGRRRRGDGVAVVRHRAPASGRRREPSRSTAP